MSEEKLLVIGAGPGGYTAAFLAADKGMKVTLVDTEAKPGGVCLHRGCIPSKTLLHLAKLIHETREAKAWGLDFGEPRIDLESVRKWKSQVTEKMASGLLHLCKQRGVRLVTGRAVFEDSNTVVVGDEKLFFDHCILATGSRPDIPDGLTGIGDRIMDSAAALDMENIPDRLLVVGGGYIGLEMGTVYAALGSRVTVVEMLDGLLPGVDRDLVRPLQARLKNDFEAILLNTRVGSAVAGDSGIRVTLNAEGDVKEETYDRALISVGRVPNSNGIGLEKTRAELDDRGFVRVDKQMKSSDPAILAIGDVVGGALLAHKASHEGKIAVEVIAGEQASFDSSTIPAMVFTDPEIAWCGLSENEARSSGVEVSVAKFPWAASGRAQTLGR
ncbi:MAG: NAD(P)/FAD-dependent oxidoreductase, partial [Nitrospinaceae bacterium]